MEKGGGEEGKVRRKNKGVIGKVEWGGRAERRGGEGRESSEKERGRPGALRGEREGRPRDNERPRVDEAGHRGIE